RYLTRPPWSLRVRRRVLEANGGVVGLAGGLPGLEPAGDLREMGIAYGFEQQPVRLAPGALEQHRIGGGHDDAGIVEDAIGADVVEQFESRPAGKMYVEDDHSRNVCAALVAGEPAPRLAAVGDPPERAIDVYGAPLA